MHHSPPADLLPGPTLCFPLNAATGDPSLNSDAWSLGRGPRGPWLTLRNGFDAPLDRAGINGVEARNGFFSAETDLDGEVNKPSSDTDWSNGGWVGERRGDGGRTGAGNVGGREG